LGNHTATRGSVQGTFEVALNEVHDTLSVVRALTRALCVLLSAGDEKTSLRISLTQQTPEPISNLTTKEIVRLFRIVTA
jgi:hypothetical protein